MIPRAPLALLLASTAALAAPPPGTNLYWPGTFEGSLHGGIFSSATNVRVTDAANHTPDGSRAWELTPATYTHLELLTDGRGPHELAFHARATQPVTVVIKVVHTNPDGGAARTTDIPVVLRDDDAWHAYAVPFDVVAPYPGPRRGEVLVTCYNGAEQPAWIDDLTVRRTGPDPEPPAEPVVRPTGLVRNGGFEDEPVVWAAQGLRGDVDVAASFLAVPGGLAATLQAAGGAHPRVIEQRFAAGEAAGRTVRVAADVAFVRVDPAAAAWSGVVIDLVDASADEVVLRPEPAPFWQVVGLAPPAGTFATITAVFRVPPGARALVLRIQAQNGLRGSVAAVDNVRLEIVETP